MEDWFTTCSIAAVLTDTDAYFLAKHNTEMCFLSLNVTNSKGTNLTVCICFITGIKVN